MMEQNEMMVLMMLRGCIRFSVNMIIRFSIHCGKDSNNTSKPIKLKNNVEMHEKNYLKRVTTHYSLSAYIFVLSKLAFVGI